MVCPNIKRDAIGFKSTIYIGNRARSAQKASDGNGTQNRGIGDQRVVATYCRPSKLSGKPGLEIELRLNDHTVLAKEGILSLLDLANTKIIPQALNKNVHFMRVRNKEKIGQIIHEEITKKPNSTVSSSYGNRLYAREVKNRLCPAHYLYHENARFRDFLAPIKLPVFV